MSQFHKTLYVNIVDYHGLRYPKPIKIKFMEEDGMTMLYEDKKSDLELAIPTKAKFPYCIHAFMCSIYFSDKKGDVQNWMDGVKSTFQLLKNMVNDNEALRE